MLSERYQLLRESKSPRGRAVRGIIHDMAEQDPTNLRLKILYVAKDQGMSMKELIEKSGVAKSVVQRMWSNSGTGVIGGPPLESISLKALERIAEVLGVTPGDLICGEKELKALKDQRDLEDQRKRELKKSKS